MKRIISILLIIILPAIALAQLNTNHVIHTGRSRLYFGNYTGAIESFNMVIKMKSYLPEPYFYRGAAKLNLDDYRGAKEDLDKAIEIKPYYPDALMYRGIVYYNLKKYDLAMNDYSEAMKLDGESADIFNNRGICKAAMHDLEGAIKDYTRSIELKPKNFNGYLNRSIAYQVLEQWDDAIDDCNQMIRIRPNSAMGYMSRGLVKIEKEDFAGALRDFDMSIYLDPKNAFAYQNRGMVKQQLESYEAAIMDYSVAIELDNKMASAYFNRGIAKEMSGQNNYQKDYNLASVLDPRFEKRPWKTDEEKEESLKQQMQARQKNPQNGKSDSLLAENSSEDDNTLRIDLEELRKRKMKANLVVEDNRDLPEQEEIDQGKVQNKNISIQLLPLFIITTINKTSADNETVGYFNMLIENLNNENNFQPYLTLSNQINQSKEAIELYKNQILIFDQRIKQNNGLTNNYLYRAIFKSLTSDFQGALNDYEKAIKINERNLLAYYMRANTRFIMIQKIQNISSGNTANTIGNDQNQSFSENNKEKNSSNDALEDILTDLSVVLYMNPDFSFGYFNRGNIYCINEKYLSALDEYNRALAIEPDFAEAYYNRGLVRILLNDVERGAKDLSKAGELGIKESYNVIKRYCN